MQTIKEIALLVVAATVLGVIWNASNDDGISLTRAYKAGFDKDAERTEVTPKLPPNKDRSNGPSSTTTTTTAPPENPPTSQPSDPPESADPEPKTQPKDPIDESSDPDPSLDPENWEKPDEEPRVWLQDDVQFCNLAYALEMYDTCGDGPEAFAFFIDARKMKEYESGHIPTAVYLDNYQVDDLIEGVRDELNERPFLIVYCNGGDCEDSINLATALVQFGFDSENVFVYKAGYEVWVHHKLPVVEGEERGIYVPR